MILKVRVSSWQHPMRPCLSCSRPDEGRPGRNRRLATVNEVSRAGKRKLCYTKGAKIQLLDVYYNCTRGYKSALDGMIRLDRFMILEKSGLTFLPTPNTL